MPATGIPRYGLPTAAYTVKVGDTLAKIARDKLGDLNLWKPLAEYNGIIDPNSLKIGQVIYLPNVAIIRAVQSPQVKPSVSLPADLDEIAVTAKRLSTKDVIDTSKAPIFAGLPSWWPIAAIGAVIFMMATGQRRRRGALRRSMQSKRYRKSSIHGVQ